MKRNAARDVINTITKTVPFLLSRVPETSPYRFKAAVWPVLS